MPVRLINVSHKGSDSTTPSLLEPLYLSRLACKLTLGWGRGELSDMSLRVFLLCWIYHYTGNAAVCSTEGF